MKTENNNSDFAKWLIAWFSFASFMMLFYIREILEHILEKL
jgi:hypothetical protein